MSTVLTSLNHCGTSTPQTGSIISKDCQLRPRVFTNGMHVSFGIKISESACLSILKIHPACILGSDELRRGALQEKLSTAR